MARPTKYNEDVLEKAKDYLESYRDYGDIIPSIEGLALHLDLSRTALYDWKTHEDKAEFSYILEKILTKQQNELLKNGLIGDFNSAITKLALGKHGFSDKIDGTVTELSQDEWLKTLA
jgi:DNA-packaging protein gp3